MSLAERTGSVLFEVRLNRLRRLVGGSALFPLALDLHCQIKVSEDMLDRFGRVAQGFFAAEPSAIGAARALSKGGEQSRNWEKTSSR